MKKVFERILFMLFGALLATGAYIVGNIDKDATANLELTTFENVRITGSLVVEGLLLVGDPLAEHGNLVHIESDKIASTIFLYHNRNRETQRSDARVMLSAGTIENIPSSTIVLRDKLGNSAGGTSRYGWSKGD